MECINSDEIINETTASNAATLATIIIPFSLRSNMQTRGELEFSSSRPAKPKAPISILRLREYGSLVTDAEVFVYTGPAGERVPIDVIRALVDPSVVSIHEGAFYGRKRLTEVELCEGLVEIGEDSFRWCVNSITKINIPISLRRIRDGAFFGSLRTPIRLHDGIESIGRDAFRSCVFTNFRVPSLITAISDGILCDCKSLFSLELSDM
jgi:hypothetical protein